MSETVYILCMRLEDGTGYRPPGAMTIRCLYCTEVCTISPASHDQWKADHQDWPHAVVCNRCIPQQLRTADKLGEQMEIMKPNAAVQAEVEAGLAILDRLDREEQ